MLSLSIALFSTVWTRLPGSYSSFKYPSYSDFTRRLQFVQPRRATEDCWVCWDSEHRLAELICGHRACERCLQLMREKFQTACPVCRQPLFDVYDRTAFVLAKGSVASATTTATLIAIRASYELQRSAYYQALFVLAPLLFTAIYLRIVFYYVHHFGETWWRYDGQGKKAKTGMELVSYALPFGTGILSLCHTLWVAGGRFDP